MSINVWSSEQLEILQASLDIDVFPERIILSSADVVHRILVFVVTERLPSVVHAKCLTAHSRKRAGYFSPNQPTWKTKMKNKRMKRDGEE